MPNKARAALIKWLGQKQRKAPTRLDQPPAKAAEGVDVTPTFQAGSMLLQRGDRLVTLYWSKTDKDRRRRLPAGDYLLRTTRIEREKSGTWWHLSSTGPAKKRVQIKQGTSISIADTVHFRSSAKLRDGKLNLGFGIASSIQRGLSVYKNGKRVPVTYKVLDKQGKLLAQGTMNYG